MSFLQSLQNRCLGSERQLWGWCVWSLLAACAMVARLVLVVVSSSDVMHFPGAAAAPAVLTAGTSYLLCGWFFTVCYMAYISVDCP